MIGRCPYQSTSVSNADLLLSMATILHSMVYTGASNGQLVSYLEVIRNQIEAAIEVLDKEYE